MPIPFRLTVTADEIAAATETVAPLSAAVARVLQGAGPDALVLSWLSDIHVSAPVEYADENMFDYSKKVDGGAQARIALAEIRALSPAPDVFLLGGDICDRGDCPDLYRHELAEAEIVFRGATPRGRPVLPILGNHDFTTSPLVDGELDQLRAIGDGWPRSSVVSDYYYVEQAGGWRIIALDSRAGIGALQRSWLADRLREDTQAPTVVMSHGPWLRCGNWVDEYRLGDDATFEMIEQAPNVKLVLSGHTHKRRAWDTGRTIHAIFPACCYGIDDATGWGAIVLGSDTVEAIFVKELKTTRWGGNEKAYIDQNGAWSQLTVEPWSVA